MGDDLPIQIRPNKTQKKEFRGTAPRFVYIKFCRVYFAFPCKVRDMPNYSPSLHIVLHQLVIIVDICTCSTIPDLSTQECRAPESLSHSNIPTNTLDDFKDPGDEINEPCKPSQTVNEIYSWATRGTNARALCGYQWLHKQQQQRHKNKCDDAFI